MKNNCRQNYIKLSFTLYKDLKKNVLVKCELL
ncbi:MAG: hypothetical protein K0S53_832 [Bacteroidetes bacterium]|jgi:hypothetical protein|nr:hypothetical protein [Bacteroidota bacterium]MDF2451461.1 hypothetical protein [Bacteroidota bacterium]